MNKKLRQFIDGEINYIETMCGLGREPLADREYITIKPTELETPEPLFNFWRYKKPKDTGKQEDAKKKGDPSSRKNRKTFYVKLSLKELKKLNKDKLNYEYTGMFLRLAAYIEWDSGFLIYGRGKNRRKMNLSDIAKVLGVSESTAWRLTYKLKKLGLLIMENEGYKVEGNLFSKGRKTVCESNLKKE